MSYLDYREEKKYPWLLIVSTKLALCRSSPLNRGLHNDGWEYMLRDCLHWKTRAKAHAMPYIFQHLKVLLLTHIYVGWPRNLDNETHMRGLKGAAFSMLSFVLWWLKLLYLIVTSAQYSHLVQRCLVESMEVRSPVLLHNQLSVSGAKKITLKSCFSQFSCSDQSFSFIFVRSTCCSNNLFSGRIVHPSSQNDSAPACHEKQKLI